MKHNIGGMDRSGRYIIGAILIVVGLLAPVNMGWQIAIFVVAGIALVTAAIRFCPANLLLGIDTSKEDEHSHGNPVAGT